MDVRIRLPELMRDGDVPTAYALSRKSEGRISMSTAHRLVGARGAVRYIDAELLDALCDVFDVGPEALLTQDDPPEESLPLTAKRRSAQRSTSRKSGRRGQRE
jgi:DNA-binding Xre family transcriptional regulator